MADDGCDEVLEGHTAVLEEGQIEAIHEILDTMQCPAEEGQGDPGGPPRVTSGRVWGADVAEDLEALHLGAGGEITSEEVGA